MWDIKLWSYIWMNKIKCIFHLNHVGYKGRVKAAQEAALAGFHLNHVGYKELKSSDNKSSDNFFHLNHVGYKVYQQRHHKAP